MASVRTPTAALKYKLASQAVQDPLFDEALAEAAAEIVSESKGAPNEATVESAFERILYAVLKQVGLPFSPVKEAPIETRLHVAKGRADSRLGGLIVEYKQPSKLKSNKDISDAQAQLGNYLEALAIHADALGFLTDGTKICEIRQSPDGSAAFSAFQKLDGPALKRLVKGIISLESRALTAENLIADFCGNEKSGLLFALSRKLDKLLTNKPAAKTEMLMSEWEALFRLSHDDKSQQKRIQDRRSALAAILKIAVSSPVVEYRALFALHTAYAILLKLIAYRVVCDVKFGQPLQDFKSLTVAQPTSLRNFLASLEDGEIFRDIGIRNLLEGDFFSWYSDASQWDDSIAGGISEILQTLSVYEDSREIFSSTTVADLFRLLYEATVPQSVRSSLGEFYTPYWLAEHVLEASRPVGRWTVLDPCCGSGTFLLAAISRMRSEARKLAPAKALLQVTERICGIDLNPLAVLTSRIHYFIHIADYLANYSGEITIPVYLGDASNIPKSITLAGVKFHQYSLKTLKEPLEVCVPWYMTDDLPSFTEVMLAFEQAVKRHDYDAGKATFLAAASVKKHPAIVEEKLSALADQIIDLEMGGWNGIWSRIISNFISTARLGPFTNVIGNPPWIDWKSLPSGYRETVKSLCVEKGLFSGAGRTGGINLNVCALVAHVAATNWLKTNGRMAFLMPRELAIQASYEGWRDAVGGDCCSLIAFHDWTNSGHPFDPVKEDFMTFIFEKKRRDQSAVPVTAYAKADRNQRAHTWPNWGIAKLHLQSTAMFAARVIKDSTSYTFARTKKRLKEFGQIAGQSAYKGREGVEFYPQELVLFRYEAKGPKPGTVWLRNIQVARSKYRIPSQRILLETKYLYPLVKGPHIGAFEYDDPDLIVAFPYDKRDPHAPVSKAVLSSKSPLLLRYFEKHKDSFEQQTEYSDALRGEGEYYGLARTGPYSFKETYVAYRDNTKWRATVLRKKRMPWGESKRYLFQNHAVSICERAKGVYITDMEACYIVAILNCPIVEQFIYASSDNRSFKIRPPVKIPLFDHKSARHKALARIGKKALGSPGSWATEALKAEALYLEICGTKRSDRKRVR